MEGSRAHLTVCIEVVTARNPGGRLHFAGTPMALVQLGCCLHLHRLVEHEILSNNVQLILDLKKSKVCHLGVLGKQGPDLRAAEWILLVELEIV